MGGLPVHDTKGVARREDEIIAEHKGWLLKAAVQGEMM
jgi:hypothetical protein